ncbi:MAG: hypothetical protein KKE86_04150, partial [Planctomycetes bacterium]|nr:hypothetical protein [Planctomycetota bacterium]
NVETQYVDAAGNMLRNKQGITDLVALQSEEGQRQYIEAAKAAFKQDYAPMIEIIRRALARAENRQ